MNDFLNGFRRAAEYCNALSAHQPQHSERVQNRFIDYRS